MFNGDHWPPEIKALRQAQGASGGAPALPARPCLALDQLSQPINQVMNEIRQADFAPELVPADDFSELTGPIDDTEIQLREGLLRRLQRDPRAKDARLWAAWRALIAGRGYYAVGTRYVDGKTWDQELTVERIYEQGSVRLDPVHEQPDGSDAEWGFPGGRNMRWDEYKTKYPKRATGSENRVLGLSDDQFEGLSKSMPDWFMNEGETRIVKVVNYFYTEYTSRELCLLEDGSSVWNDELEDGEEPLDSRVVLERQIKWAVLDGDDDGPLEETDWQGPDLPIVKIMGNELLPSDGKRRAQGMVRPARSGQEGYDYMASKLVEAIALAPLPSPVVVEGTVEEFPEWQTANTRAWPYKRRKQKDSYDQPAPGPEYAQIDTPIQAITQALQMFNQSIQSTTMHDPAVGKVDPSLKSGRAIAQIVQQGQQGVSQYLENFQHALRYEAQIENNLFAAIYGRPGRLARIMTGEGETQTVLLHQPSIQTPQGPQASQPDPMTGQHPPNAKTWTLTKEANFNIVIHMAKQSDTLREEESSLFGQLIQSNPEFITWFGDLLFKNLDGPGHEEAAERAKVMLAPPIQQLLQAKAQGQTPDPQAAAMQAQLQHLGGQLQQAQQDIQSKQVEMQSRERIAQAEIESKERIAAADRQVKLDVAAITKGIEDLKLFMQEKLRLGLQQADAAAQGHSQAHDAGMQAMQQEADAQQAQQAQQAAAQQSAQSHQQTLEQGQQAAALAPSPASPAPSATP